MPNISVHVVLTTNGTVARLSTVLSMLDCYFTSEKKYLAQIFCGLVRGVVNRARFEGSSRKVSTIYGHYPIKYRSNDLVIIKFRYVNSSIF